MSIRTSPIWVKKRLIRNSEFDRVTGCLNWLGATNTHGYPVFRLGGDFGKTVTVHRYLLTLKIKREPNQACHSCNNKTCISTALGHVYDGSRSDNAFDRERSYREHPTR